MISADVGAPTPLELMLFDGAGTKGVRARIRTTSGDLVDTISLAHVGDGLYTGSWTPLVNGYYHAVFIVFTDGTYATEDVTYTRRSEPYRVTFPGGVDPSVYASAVWDSALSGYHTNGSFGAAISELLAGSNPATIGGAVWEALVADHRTPNTFGDWVQAIWEFSKSNNEELKDPTWGLDMIYSLIQNRSSLILNDVSQVDNKVSDLTPLIANVESNLESDILANKVLIEAMTVQNNVDKLEVIDEIHVTNTKVDAVGSLVSSLQNNTTARFVVPERLVKPQLGTKAYQFHLRIYDNKGNPNSPDTTPTIRVRRLDTGVDLVTNAIMSQDGVKVGAYFYTFTISAGTDLYPALVETAITEGSVVRYIPSVTEVTEFEADLDAIQAQLAIVDTKVTGTQLQINNPTYGLAAIRTGELDILTAIGNEASTLGLIKTRTDLIPNNTATRSDIDDVIFTLSDKPNLAAISTILATTEAAIMGPDLRTVTDVYDLWDLSSVAKTNDPRFNNLDAKVSTRSTLSAAQVWGYSTRTLTSQILDPISIKEIWDYLCSEASTSGSIGKRIVDYLDAPISTRATPSDLLPALSNVAQQSTLLDLQAESAAGFLDSKSRLINLNTKLTSVKSKTDTLPVDPASDTTVSSGVGSITSSINNLDLKVQQVKAKTDHIPADPAKESSVVLIPTNPLRDDDARLDHLDANISSRSTLSSAELSTLARRTDVAFSQDVVVEEVVLNRELISAVLDLVTHIKPHTDRIPIDTATLSALFNVEAALLAAIEGIPVSSLTAHQVWEYPTRTITQDPTSFGPDISNLATKEDVAAISSLSHYENKMTTIFNPSTSLQEVLVWGEKNGQSVLASEGCAIEVKDSSGGIMWSQSSSTPNSDGIYRFTNPIVVLIDNNYYITISIKIDGDFKTTTQAFITVG